MEGKEHEGLVGEEAPYAICDYIFHDFKISKKSEIKKKYYK